MASLSAEKPKAAIFDCNGTLVRNDRWIPATGLLAGLQSEGYELFLVTDTSSDNVIFREIQANCPEMAAFFDGRVRVKMSLEDKARMALKMGCPIVDDSLFEAIAYNALGELNEPIRALCINPNQGFDVEDPSAWADMVYQNITQMSL
jgi:hypothetical protein